MAQPPPVRVNPWAALGLTGNPFRRLDGEALVRSLLEAADPDDRSPIRAWLRDDADVVQFIGQAGWGKSTRLVACHTVAVAEDRGGCRFDYIPLGTRHITIPPKGRTELPRLWSLDEVNRLTPRCRRQLARWAAAYGVRLLLGTHDDVVGDMEAAGLRVRTVRLQPADRAAIARFIKRRRELSATAPDTGTRLRVTEAAVRLVCDDAAGNLSRAEYVLYEAAQHAVEQIHRGAHMLMLDMPQIRGALQALAARGATGV
ncbi:MAG: hypothetical protein JXA69_13885 [Phycisphaerae bacterium]|nr:hypothetical protein [Phycisphaerae bacterium]